MIALVLVIAAWIGPPSASASSSYKPCGAAIHDQSGSRYNISQLQAKRVKCSVVTKPFQVLFKYGPTQAETHSGTSDGLGHGLRWVFRRYASVRVVLTSYTHNSESPHGDGWVCHSHVAARVLNSHLAVIGSARFHVTWHANPPDSSCAGFPDERPPNETAPTAAFLSSTNLSTVTFADESSAGSNRGEPLDYTEDWDFGDGTHFHRSIDGKGRTSDSLPTDNCEPDPNPGFNDGDGAEQGCHQYPAQPADHTYRITLTVKSSDGLTSTYAKDETVPGTA
jgi:hypothetical protein